MRIEYQEYQADEVLRPFIQGFRCKKKEENIYSVEWFFDPAKDRFLFKLFIDENEPPQRP